MEEKKVMYPPGRALLVVGMIRWPVMHMQTQRMLAALVAISMLVVPVVAQSDDESCSWPGAGTLQSGGDHPAEGDMSYCQGVSTVAGTYESTRAAGAFHMSDPEDGEGSCGFTYLGEVYSSDSASITWTTTSPAGVDGVKMLSASGDCAAFGVTLEGEADKAAMLILGALL